MKHVVLILLLLCTRFITASAQVSDAPYVSWDEFVQAYIETFNESGEEGETNEELRNRLEYLKQNPLQLNLMQRVDLLQFPFIDEERADSILSYRLQKHGFVSLGELQLIKGMDYYTRAYLSLFVRCDSVFPPTAKQLLERQQPPLKHKVVRGGHELESRLDIPLYQRAGYAPKRPTNTNWYSGNSLHHLLRYRYHYKREVLYGFTLEKDGGEPAFKQGFYPYDYMSGYVLLRPRAKRWGVVVGDYNLYAARGLLLGKQSYVGRTVQAHALQRPLTTFKAHTSTNESNYFRGLAASYTWSAYSLTAYASYRKLDGRVDHQSSDTIRSILKTGLHRTLSEIKARRTLGCVTAGASVSYNRSHFTLSASSVYTHYSRVVSPDLRKYNAYYFRGRTAVTSSLAYYCTFNKFTGVGEWAIDYKGHLAIENTLAYKFTPRLSCSIQQRHFSPRFISINGRALQQGSRVANEQGLVLSGRYLPISRLELVGYVDCFRFPKPTANAYADRTHGIEAMLQSTYSVNSACSFLLRYQVKQKQYNFTYEKKQFIENRVVNKFRLASMLAQRTYNCTFQADASYATRQSGQQHWGAMVSARAGWQPSAQVNLKAMLGIFFTDHYDSRLYVYEPQLLYASGSSAWADHGWRGVVLANWQCLKTLTLSLRFATLNYFNCSSISAGTEKINSSWKNDLSVQVRWRI